MKMMVVNCCVMQNNVTDLQTLSILSTTCTPHWKTNSTEKLLSKKKYTGVYKKDRCNWKKWITQTQQ